MASTVRRLLERVRMHDGRTMLHMDVRKKRDTAIIRNKKYRQQPLYILTIVSLTLYHRYFVGKDTTIFLIALFYIFLRF